MKASRPIKSVLKKSESHTVRSAVSDTSVSDCEDMESECSTRWRSTSLPNLRSVEGRAKRKVSFNEANNTVHEYDKDSRLERRLEVYEQQRQKKKERRRRAGRVR